MKIFLKNTLLSIAIITIAMLFSCGNKTKTINELPQKDTFPTEEAKDITLFYSDSGKIEAKMTAHTMKRYSTEMKKLVFPNGIFVIFYDSLGKKESTLKANYAIRHEAEHRTEAKYDVEINTKDSTQLFSEHLIWDEVAGKIKSDVFVKIVTPDKIIWGDGFESDERMENYHINNPKGEIIINEKNEKK